MFVTSAVGVCCCADQKSCVYFFFSFVWTKYWCCLGDGINVTQVHAYVGMKPSVNREQCFIVFFFSKIMHSICSCYQKQCTVKSESMKNLSEVKDNYF